MNKRINFCGRRIPEELRTAWFNGFDAGSNGVQIDIEGYDEDAILTYDYDDDDRYSEDDEEKKVRLILTALFVLKDIE